MWGMVFIGVGVGLFIVMFSYNGKFGFSLMIIW